jgi:hypothetical protein
MAHHAFTNQALEYEWRQCNHYVSSLRNFWWSKSYFFQIFLLRVPHAVFPFLAISCSYSDSYITSFISPFQFHSGLAPFPAYHQTPFQSLKW